ncbi:MAG TPA: hypothetical protein VGL38_04800 [bacterium]|jgi:hypothetical protein
MKRILGGMLLLTFVAAMVIFGGCDSPNSPESQPQPYHLAATYSFSAAAKHVVASGDLAAVAVGAYGGVVLNVRDLAHIDTVARFPGTSAFTVMNRAMLDTLNHLVAFASNPVVGGVGSNPAYDYLHHSYVAEALPSSISFGAFLATGIVSQRNNVLFLGGEGRGTSGGSFVGYRMQRDSDTSQWVPTGSADFTYGIPTTSFGSTNAPQGVDRRATDGISALATEEAGVIFLDSVGTQMSALPFAGAAYDCKWYRDSLLIVAGDFEMVVMNARDAAHPETIGRLTIPTSDRMRGVAIDGGYACVMDGYDGIYVVDITNPRTPAYVQLMKLDSPTSVWADAGRIYTTEQVGRLSVFTR